MRNGQAWWVGWVCCSMATVCAASIHTAVLEQPWPKQWVHEYEVGRYSVRWRQRASAEDGISSGASFTAPSALERTWTLANDYRDLGTITPGVSSVRVLEQTPTRQVLQIDIKVLWKTLRLIFEIEQDPPRATRFRLTNEVVGEYLGVCLFAPEGGGTRVELSTRLKPAVHIPPGLVLSIERMVMLRSIREFLETCEQRGPAAQSAAHRAAPPAAT